MNEHKQAQEILTAAISKYGKQAQMLMVLEEMSELQKEICKNFRGKNNTEEIADEIADVEIMLGQLRIMFDIEDMVQKHVSFKLDRLAKRMGETI
jgi:NTP pyrophosphatase (non-canonical NTP hydrolase)